MSPGRSATFMTDYWWSVSQWDDLFDDDKTSNDNWAMDFHKVQQLLFEIKGSKLLLLLLCCCCNPFFYLVCQVFTFLLLFLSAMNSSSSEWMTNWPSSSSKMHPGMCSNSVERAKKIKNWCERVKAKKRRNLTNNTFQGQICFVLLVLRQDVVKEKCQWISNTIHLQQGDLLSGLSSFNLG